MGGKVDIVVLKTVNSAKIIKWKVKEGAMISIGRVILIYEHNLAEGKKEQKKMKSTHVGTIKKILAKEEEIIQPGEPLLELEECLHPTVMKDMCAECGTDLTKLENSQTNASVSMVHTVPELKVSHELAQILGNEDKDRLIGLRKLVLLVDLDQTLIHTTNDDVPPTLKDVYHFQLHSNGPWFHTRLRPNTLHFLNQMSEFYELHICTFGARNYAHAVANILDKDGKFFSHRILSRDECFDPNSKTANLKALFPCGDDMVCIIDDREDVWNYLPNLIHVKAYHFFKHTGDINAPPGLTKKENDEKHGIEFKIHDNNYKVTTKTTEETNSEIEKNKCTVLETKEREMKSELNSVNDDSNDKNKTTLKDVNVINSVEVDLREEVIKENLETKISEKSKIEENEKKKILKEEMIEKKNHEVNEEEKNDILKEEIIEKNSQDKNEILKEEVSEINNKRENEEEKNDILKEVIEKNDQEKNEILKEEVSEKNKKEEEKNDILKEEVIEKNDQEKNEILKVEVSEKNKKEEEKNDILKEEGENKNEKIELPKKEVIEKIYKVENEKEILEEDLIEKNKQETNLSEQEKENNSYKENPETPKDKELDIVDDDDDYLLYLGDILKTVHSAYYELYDQSQAISYPQQQTDLKKVVPYVRRKVLAGFSLVFSGLVPTHTHLKSSRPFRVARALGASVTQDLTSTTTHLVAARPGTAKSNNAQRRANIKIVSPQWLWVCAERWQHVDERLFPLIADAITQRHPPPHCSPEHPSRAVAVESYYQTQPSLRKRTLSGSFADSINPLMTFSSEDLATMVGEVKDDCNDSEEDEGEIIDEVDEETTEIRLNVDPDQSTSSSESLAGDSGPHGWVDQKHSRKRLHEGFVSTGDLTTEDDDEEGPRAKFRRGEHNEDTEEPDELPGSDDSLGSDGEWCIMGAALEREFLSSNPDN